MVCPISAVGSDLVLGRRVAGQPRQAGTVTNLVRPMGSLGSLQGVPHCTPGLRRRHGSLSSSVVAAIAIPSHDRANRQDDVKGPSCDEPSRPPSQMNKNTLMFNPAERSIKDRNHGS